MKHVELRRFSVSWSQQESFVVFICGERIPCVAFRTEINNKMADSSGCNTCSITNSNIQLSVTPSDMLYLRRIEIRVTQSSA